MSDRRAVPDAHTIKRRHGQNIVRTDENRPNFGELADSEGEMAAETADQALTR